MCAMLMTIQEVEKIMRLAKLEFQSEEKAKLMKELEQIVSYLQKLEELDTEAVSDMQNSRHGDVFREDRVDSSLTQDEALDNAPKQSHGLFSVPKVIR